MLSRALILATVTLLIGDLATAPAHAQATNLEAGKSPSQIFAGTCTVCHKSPRGLLKTVAPGSLPAFLKQHYTTSPDMAGLLASYLISNGATDTKYGSQTKPDKDAKSDGKPGGPVEQLDRQGRRLHTAAPDGAKPDAKPETKPEAEPRQAARPEAKPDADGVTPQGEAERKGRNGKRLPRPADEAAKPAEGEAAAGERGPDGRKLTAKQRLSKRGKPGTEEPKDTNKDTGKPDIAKVEPATAAPAKDDKPASETAKQETKPEAAKPSEAAKPDAAKTDAPKDAASKEPGGQTPAARPDPAPAVTSAPAATTATSAPASSAPAPAAAATSAPPAATIEPVRPAASASAPPPAPVAPAGPPAPPISQ